MAGIDILFIEPVVTMLNKLGAFVPQLFGALLILLVGWIIAKVLSGFVQKILDQVKFNSFSDKIGFSAMLTKGGVMLSASSLLAGLVYWAMMLLVFTVVVDSMGLVVAAHLLERVTGFIPNVIAAVFVALIGMFFANLIYSIIKAAASNIDVARAELLGTIAKIAILLFTTVMTFEQLRISTFFVSTTFQIFFAALCLALGLAFGLGGKDLAAKILWDFYNKQNIGK